MTVLQAGRRAWQSFVLSSTSESSFSHVKRPFSILSTVCIRGKLEFKKLGFFGSFLKPHVLWGSQANGKGVPRGAGIQGQVVARQVVA